MHDMYQDYSRKAGFHNSIQITLEIHFKQNEEAASYQAIKSFKQEFSYEKDGHQVITCPDKAGK